MCYERLLSGWGVPAFPLTTAKLRMLGASLKAGGYRSSANVLSQFKVDCERLGFEFSGPQIRLIADINRSCRRGLGAPLRALPPAALPAALRASRVTIPSSFGRTGRPKELCYRRFVVDAAGG